MFHLKYKNINKCKKNKKCTTCYQPLSINYAIQINRGNFKEQFFLCPKCYCFYANEDYVWIDNYQWQLCGKEKCLTTDYSW